MNRLQSYLEKANKKLKEKKTQTDPNLASGFKAIGAGDAQKLLSNKTGEPPKDQQQSEQVASDDETEQVKIDRDAEDIGNVYEENTYINFNHKNIFKIEFMYNLNSRLYKKCQEKMVRAKRVQTIKNEVFFAIYSYKKNNDTIMVTQEDLKISHYDFKLFLKRNFINPLMSESPKQLSVYGVNVYVYDNVNEYFKNPKSLKKIKNFTQYKLMYPTILGDKIITDSKACSKLKTIHANLVLKDFKNNLLNQNLNSGKNEVDGFIKTKIFGCVIENFSDKDFGVKIRDFIKSLSKRYTFANSNNTFFDLISARPSSNIMYRVSTANIHSFVNFFNINPELEEE